MPVYYNIFNYKFSYLHKIFKLFQKDMYKLIILILLFAFIEGKAQLLPGQKEPDEIIKEDTSNEGGGGYVALTGKFPNIDKKWTAELGFRAGARFENFGLGFGIYTLLTQNIDLSLPGSPYYHPFLRYTYGGIEAEYLFLSKKNSIFLGNILIGLGNMNDKETSRLSAPFSMSGKWYFIIEPAIGIDFRIFRKYWLGLTGGYRLTAGTGNFGLSSSDMNGIVLAVSFKIL
jgi:hypothetical protein